jgi:hypothetical protein
VISESNERFPGEQEFLGERTRAMATIVFTRRSDLSIVETKKGSGLDFHVYIDRDEKPMRLMFGVLLKGTPSPVTIDQANTVLGLTLEQFQRMGKFTYPVCLLFFTMRDEGVFFSWLAEPVVNGGVPKLVHHDRADCVELANERLDQLVETIVSWYDSVETALIA